MDILTFVVLLLVAVNGLKAFEQRKRIQLLGSYLARFQLEQLMESLMEGYLRAQGEQSPERKLQISRVLETAEETLHQQLTHLGRSLAALRGQDMGINKLPVFVPFLTQLWPAGTVDLRKMLSIHADGLQRVAANAEQLSARDRAFTLTAELLLMQHTFHWYCRSKVVASARLLMRHQTPYAQVLDSVSPPTRRAYEALL
jgi:hypothetical protein